MRIGVIDYGMGNLHSVAKALASTNARVRVTDSKSQLKSMDMLVVPGVGSFGAGMANLARKRLDDFICAWVADEKPFLGICLGLQFLFERSEESPRVRGLGIFRGSVVRFRPKDFNKNAYQVPHMGWNNPVRENVRGAAYFKNISSRDYFYFVHTFYPAPDDDKLVLTKTKYGKNFCSSVAAKRLVATQFHPEKSGDVGLKFLKNVVSSMDVQ